MFWSSITWNQLGLSLGSCSYCVYFGGYKKETNQPLEQRVPLCPSGKPAGQSECATPERLAEGRKTAALLFSKQIHLKCEQTIILSQMY